MSLFTKKDPGGNEVVMVRTNHPWLHPTKGWRNFARPGGAGGKANRRRKLILQGGLCVRGSAKWNAVKREETPCRHQQQVFG